MTLQFPKWKYRRNPETGQYQCTLVADAAVEVDLGSTWTDNPHEHGIEVVPLTAELKRNGKLIHIPENVDANGNYAYGPIPTSPGILRSAGPKRN